MEVIFTFMIGTVFGSFFGLVIDRLPTGESIIFGHSHCSNCQRKLTPLELFPILSALIAGFHCFSCHARIPLWYAGLELSCGCLFVSAWLGALSLSQVFVLLMSIILSIFDWQYHEFPLIIWLIFTVLIFLVNPFQPFTFFWLILSALTEIFNLKIGSGDLLWLYTVSLTLPFLQEIWIIQLASILGIFTYFLTKHKGEIAFIPYLSLSYFVVTLLFQIQ